MFYGNHSKFVSVDTLYAAMFIDNFTLLLYIYLIDRFNINYKLYLYQKFSS